MKDIYPSTTLESLQKEGLITARAYNGLYYARMSTVGDILKYIDSGNNLIDIHRLGRKSTLEVEKILRACRRNAEIVIPDQPFDRLSDKIKDILNLSFESVECEVKNTADYIRVRYPDARIFFNLIARGKDEALEIQQNLNKDENVVYRKWHVDVINEILTKLEAEKLEEDTLYLQLSNLQAEIKKEYMEFSISDLVSYFISNETDELLQNMYNALCIRVLSVRASNFKQKYLPTYKDVIPFFDKPLAEYSNICPGHGMRKTLLEIYGLVQKFKEEAFSSYEQYSDPEEMHRLSLKKAYPFLSGAQRDFVGSYQQEYQIRPILYILYNYIRISTEREHVYFSLYHGLFDDARYTLDEIAQLDNLSRERVRQIVNNKTCLLSNFRLSSDEIDHYQDILNVNVITSDSPEFKNIITEEHLPSDFGIFSSLCSLISNLEIFEGQGYRILVSPNLKNYLNPRAVIEKFNKIYNKGFAEDTVLPFSQFTGKIPSCFNSDIKNLMGHIIKNKRGVILTDAGIIFEQSKIDIEREIYGILSSAGRPLHLDEIFAAFKSLYPDHKYTSPSQIKPYIFRNPQIQAKGMQSVYGLDSWGHVYFGNIRNLLYDTLKNSTEPMHISDIFKVVKEHFPTTNIKSLMASMGGDTYGRFVQFEDGFFGISERRYASSFVKLQSLPRYKFDQRLQMFRTFVDTYQRFPFFNGGDEEASLQRWLYNATHDNIDLSEDETVRLNAMLNYYLGLGYPQTATEHEFLSNCKEYERFISRNHKRPSSTVGAELYQWFNRSKGNFQGYRDQRYDYFTELCRNITSFGFALD